jgi:hypothetical protein
MPIAFSGSASIGIYPAELATDLHYHTVAPFHLAVKNEHPSRVVGMGGIWVHRDEREVPDTFLTAADYPSRFSLTVQSTQANEIGFRTLIGVRKPLFTAARIGREETYGHLKVVPEKPFQQEFADRGDARIPRIRHPGRGG